MLFVPSAHPLDQETDGSSLSFLDLMASSPESFLVPTLDIDLAWHTHQMKCSKYMNDCLSLVKRFVNQ